MNPVSATLACHSCANLPPSMPGNTIADVAVLPMHGMRAPQSQLAPSCTHLPSEVMATSTTGTFVCSSSAPSWLTGGRQTKCRPLCTSRAPRHSDQRCGSGSALMFACCVVWMWCAQHMRSCVAWCSTSSATSQLDSASSNCGCAHMSFFKIYPFPNLAYRMSLLTEI